jgi:cytochrome b involved in lipid metabolism
MKKVINNQCFYFSMKKLTFIFGILCFIFLLGCSKEVEIKEEIILSPAELMIETGYILDEVIQHNTAEDCWMVIDGKVYDVTRIIASHPEDKALLENCGKDATELYETRSKDSLPTYYLADLQ